MSARPLPRDAASAFVARQEVRQAVGVPLDKDPEFGQQTVGGFDPGGFITARFAAAQAPASAETANPSSGGGGGGPSIGSIFSSALPAIGSFAAGNSTPLGMLTSIAGPFLPDGMGKYLSMGQSFLTKGFAGLFGGGGADGVVGIDGIAGLGAGCFGGAAGDAVGLGALLDPGKVFGMMEGMVGQFLPPELQGVWSAVQSAGGLQGLSDLAFGAPELEDKETDTSKGSGNGLPAARVGDPHVCPAFDGPKPHVGGPILPPCMVTVLIGGMPAARVTDKAMCAGPPDSISAGEDTVLIGRLPAARETDPTAHGGRIVKGFPTVLIGKSAVPQAKCSGVAAKSGKAAILPAPGGFV